MEALIAPNPVSGPTAFSGPFLILFVIVGLIVLAGFVYVGYALVRNRRRLRDAGHDPTTINADLAARAMNSRLLAPADGRPVADRLAELDRLHAAGSITDAERTAARASILGS